MILDTKGRIASEGLKAFEETVNDDYNPVVYLAIDPGKNNGICGYDIKCYLQFMYTIQEEDIAEFLDIFKHVRKCIVEDFVLYPHKAKQQVYSNMLTSRVIGRIEDWGRRKELEIIMQKATIKETGYKWAGKQPLPKSNPASHALDAHIHFIYWAVKNKKMHAKDLLR